MPTDKLRALNSLLAAFGWMLFYLETKGLWPNITPARRMRYISIQLFALTIVYGSLEAAYWPEYQFRIALAFSAVVTMIAAGVMGIKARRHPKDPSA